MGGEEEMPAVVLQAAAHGNWIPCKAPNNLFAVINVDDDNMSAPENVPNNNTNTGMVAYQDWGYSGLLMLNVQQG